MHFAHKLVRREKKLAIVISVGSIIMIIIMHQASA